MYAATLVGTVAPFQPTGSLKPTAMCSDLSETAKRRMSSDMSGPLSEKPDGPTPQALVTNTCLPAGEPPNKTPIFITGDSDARTFLTCLGASCPCDLTAQIKGEKLMVVPSTADGFKAAASALAVLRWGRECGFSHLHAPGGPLCAASGEEPG
jgi:hypothetical protein